MDEKGILARECHRVDDQSHVNPHFLPTFHFPCVNIHVLDTVQTSFFFIILRRNYRAAQGVSRLLIIVSSIIRAVETVKINPTLLMPLQSGVGDFFSTVFTCCSLEKKLIKLKIVLQSKNEFRISSFTRQSPLIDVNRKSMKVQWLFSRSLFFIESPYN